MGLSTLRDPLSFSLSLSVSILILANFSVLAFSFDNTMGQGKIRFITNKMCPFAQKAWISLECAEIPYKMEEISLYGAGGKPDWFWELNPSGTVPVLVVKDDGSQHVYPDSDLILEVVAGELLENPLTEAAEQAPIVHEWRDAVNKMLPVGKKAVLGGGKAKLAKLLQETMESRLEEGSKFLAGDLSIADCHAFPFLWRLDQEYGLTNGLECPKLGAWLESCSKIPAFQRTVQHSWWWWW